MRLLKIETDSRSAQRFFIVTGRNELKILAGVVENARRNMPRLETTIPLRSQMREIMRDLNKMLAQ